MPKKKKAPQIEQIEEQLPNVEPDCGCGIVNTVFTSVPDPQFVELCAAYADARDLIAVYRNLRYAPALQAKAARLFDALKQICEVTL